MSDLPPTRQAGDERAFIAVIAFIFCGFLLGIGVLFFAVILGGGY